jgi:DNA-binding transcriptional ArsR family regulator
MSAPRRNKPEKTLSQPNEVAEIFKALADPSRLRILSDLAGNDACVHELCETLQMSQPAVSHHLRQLRAQRLVTTRRTGREIFYVLATNAITDMLELARRHVEAS